MMLTATNCQSNFFRRNRIRVDTFLKRSPPLPNPLPRGGGEGTKPNALRWVFVWFAIAVAFPLAAVQLLPTWELKQRSQRSDVSEEHRPGYGHLPPIYWSQAIAPWYWYTQPIDPALEKLPNYAGAEPPSLRASSAPTCGSPSPTTAP